MQTDSSPHSTTFQEDIDSDGLGGFTYLWGTWEFWCDLPPNPNEPLSSSLPSSNVGSSWLSQLQHVGVLDNAEAFWGLFHCLRLPSALPLHSSYFLFRSHILPMWEHEANRRGGKWVLTFTHLPSSSGAGVSGVGTAPRALLAVDVAWQKLCLAALGELFPGEEVEICGIAVTRARAPAAAPGLSSFSLPSSPTGQQTGLGQWRVCVWTRHAADADAQMAIAKFIRELLMEPEGRGREEAGESGLGPDSASGLPPTAPVSAALTPPTSAAASSTRTTAAATPAVVVSPLVGFEKPSGARMVLNYMSHREVMEARLRRAQGHPPPEPFKPKYTLEL